MKQILMARRKVVGKNVLLLNFTYIIMSSKNGIPLKKQLVQHATPTAAKVLFLELTTGFGIRYKCFTGTFHFITQNIF